jgi:F-type H+-transporting ATPase subunit a
LKAGEIVFFKKMALLRLILLAAAMFFAPLGLDAAEDATIQNVTPGAKVVSAKEAHSEVKEHEEGLPLYSPVLKDFGWFKITSSMVLTWTVAILLIICAQFATRNIKEVPEGAQNFWEWLVEGLYGFMEGILGYELTKKTFWFFATLFILILACNWFGLVPGVGSVGWGHPTGTGTFFGFPVLGHVALPVFRGANADLNMTFAMSMVFFALWIVWAFQANGPGGFILHLFGPKGDTTGILKLLMVIIFAIVGVLEVVSILFRPVSLSFRLFGNIYAGENMLEAMAKLVPPPVGWLIPIPFYGMELLVGLAQALVFMLLTAVFTLLICTHEEGHSKHEH